ncbi:putative inositol polyphosphate phosphatase [Leptomonas pyrrhocoris]|uniref:Putative inositol polyphosphate phosphatase n=1 Tax=Leptomonas pyrrhocoris TaxID=157538 RepID=A0A0M9FZI0_LEPPY|nr:putative inositol polyphosphate phosphatase [Leptomonas pyrrhocoris]KPA79107.1 putative inositol polyphosphate phosphatase [Leptomonas pyrrhocoris]|eukprot:XP_015657546.1 putative inositol polyphosphate phosphatase [Leptomonas pyrrhocoris]
MAAASSSALPRACLRPLQQPPLDAITVYNTATHCYLLATDSLQRDFHLLACRKHSLDEAVSCDGGANTSSSNHTFNTASESDLEDRGGRPTLGTPSQRQQGPFCGLEDLHDHTTYAVYSPTEAASLVEALQREHGASMQVVNAVALLGAVRFTEGYYLVLVTERRSAAYLGVHRLFEAAAVELVSLLLDGDWAAEQMPSPQSSRRSGEMEGLSLFSMSSGGGGAAAAAASGSSNSGGPTTAYRKPHTSYRKSSSSATAAAAAYLFQRRSLEELYRQQFLSSLSRSSSFFYSHSYDLTNTLQRNTLAGGAEARAKERGEEVGSGGEATPPPLEARQGDTSRTKDFHGSNATPDGSSLHLSSLHQPRMQYVWNEYLLEPWELPERAAAHTDADERERSTSPNGRAPGAADDTAGMCACGPDGPSAHSLPSRSRAAAPQYPAAFARWRTYIMHGYVTQRTVVVHRPAFHTLLLTLIARVSKASAGVRYLRRGINSDGQVANHVEVEQIVSDESAWNRSFTEGALSSYVQLRGSVPLRWYHPPTASRLLPKPPIVIGPPDAEWSATCLHFQDLLRQYGGPILAHDLLKRREHHARECVLGDAYRAAAQALSAAVDRAAARHIHRTERQQQSSHEEDPLATPLRSSDVLQYESTDLRDLGPLAWNTMTAIAEHHFDQGHCFVCRRRPRVQSADANPPSSSQSAPATTSPAHDDCPAVAVQLQCGVVRSNCLDCIDRTNLGQLFHGLHALGEQLAGLGLLHHAADLRDSPAVTELLLEMYLAMGDALAMQYGGSAQVGAGVLHRGAGWDQLMGVKRLYNNMMGDREKQEAIKLLLGRTQPHPRQHSRARNADMHRPGQVLPLAWSTSLSDTPSLNSSITAATPGLAEAAAAAAARGSPSNRPYASPSTETALVSVSSASFFTNVLRAASRWWGEATGVSSAASTAAAAAAVEALRAAQHAAAEAEAEPDYYENVSAGPRLPPVGLLASWWVQPLNEFAAWYAACGIAESGGAGADEQPQRSRRDEEGEKAAAGPSLSLQSSSAEPPSRSPIATGAPARLYTVPAATLDDALAQHLLAEDDMAQQRWLLYVARWERQACLAPSPSSLLHQQRGAAASSTSGGVGLGPAEHDGRWASPVTNFNLWFNRGVGSGGESVPSRTTAAAAVAAGSSMQPSVSTWGMEEVVETGGAADPPESALLLSDGPSMSASTAAAAAASDADSAFAPLSLTLTPSLFDGPWIVLRTTTHLLPLDDASHPSSTTTTATARRNGTKPKETPSTAAALRLLDSWRGAKDGHTKAAASLSPFTSHGNREYPAAWLMDSAVVLAVMRQLFGCVPADAASIVASSSLSSSPRNTTDSVSGPHKWRCPEEAHDHKAFPRTVHTSVFAQQAEALEALACCETLSVAAGIGVGNTATLLPLPGTENPRRGEASLRWTGDRHIGSVRGFAPLPQPNGMPPQITTLSVAGCAWKDQHFTAALLSELYGPPDYWGTEEVVVVLQRLLYPAPLSPAVQRVLRDARLQPALSGAELMNSNASQATKGTDSVRSYWQRRLSAAERSQVETSQQHPTQEKAAASKSASEALSSAVTLLCRLSSILRSATSVLPESALGGGRSRSSSPVTPVPPPFYMLDHESDGVSMAGSRPSDGAPVEEETSAAAAVEPLLQDERGDVPAAVRLQLLLPDHPCLPECARRYWLLCRLFQPLFPSSVLSLCLLHRLLQSLFCEVPCTGADNTCLTPSAVPYIPHRTRDHVRYTFALSPQIQTPPQPQQQQHREQQIRSQLAAGAFTSLSSGGGGGAERAPSLPSSSSTAAAVREGSPFSSSNLTSSSSSAVHAVHIPATLKVKRCCSALELFRWCAQFRTNCGRAHVAEGGLSRPSSSSTAVKGAEVPRVEADEEAASASWRILWWAVENNVVVPVVRRREQTTLEMLADETALFCVVDDVPRVALNIERRSRGEVWRHAEQHDHLAGGCACGGGLSAIYGVHFAASFPVHRLMHRSALADMITLSETIASLGLGAAARLQEFFRDYTQHGWTRIGLRASSNDNGGGGGHDTANTSCTNLSRCVSSLPSTGAGATVAAGNEGGESGIGGCGPSSPSATAAADASVAVTPADIITHFSQLAEEYLQSIQSVMVALQFVSLDALADEHALHAHVSFFINVYNAAYVVAWLTNVKELISSAATAMEKVKVAASLATPRLPRPSAAAGAGSALRTVDLLPLPTLCNTNIACFMHTYGVVIGHVFVSLEEMKYGVLGGNRPPPYRDTPLWSSSLGTASSTSPSTQPQQPNGADMADASAHRSSSDSRRSSWRWMSLVPLHLRAEIPEPARLSSLRGHAHLQAALKGRELCDLYAPDGAANKQKITDERRDMQPSSSLPPPQPQSSGKATRAPSVSSVDASLEPLTSRGAPPPSSTSAPSLHGTPKSLAHTTASLYPTTPAFEQQRRRYGELAEAWSTDVVRHLPFRICLQLIDTYLPPPIFHLCHATEGSSRADGTTTTGGGADGGSMGGVNARAASLDAHLRLDVDAERVPWHLQPILNTMPLVLPALQSSKLGAVYSVACDGDRGHGRARGALVPQVNPEANGVLLQPGRMWSSPSYYVVGGDGANAEAATAHAFQLLQSLSGSYLGVHGYRSGGSSSSGSGPAVAQHLCVPMHHEEVLAQLRATEAAFRTALRSTDPQLFAKTQTSSSAVQRQQQRTSPRGFDSPPGAVGTFPSPPSRYIFGVSNAASCSAAFHNAMKPLLYDWCRATDEGMESISLLAKQGSQLRVLLKVVQLLEASYASAEAVRQSQLAVRETQCRQGEAHGRVE